MEKSKAQASGEAAPLPDSVVDHRHHRTTPARGRRKGRPISVWLTALEFDGVEAFAASMGLGRSAWVGALVRCRVHAKPTFGPSDEQSLISVLVELRRIGVDISQTLRVIDAAVSGGKVLDAERAYLTGLRAEIRSQMQAIHKAFDGNMAFWSASHE